MDISDLGPGAVITGSKWSEPIEVKIVERRGKYIRIVASTTRTGKHIDQMISVSDLADMSVQAIPTDFSSDARKVFLALESRRYRLASAYDPLLAMNTSKIDPLPHQIEAVYGYVLRQQPTIRFLLAHDPGAGKTIMAGLIIKELKLRRIVSRTLIITPGHLRDQWMRELKEKFEETFTIVDRGYMSSMLGKSPWDKESQAIASLDFAKRDDIRATLDGSGFDLIIVDEAHKMSATRYAGKVDRTDRYKLGEVLSDNSDHLLFLTATPHKGDPENFRLLLDLLKPGFFGTPELIQESKDKGDNPLFLRRTKEDMIDFDGKPLFVGREVQTPDVELSESEIMLYNSVSRYVRDEYNKAIRSERKGIGFALLILQRRMASSTYALYKSLERRKKRLEGILSGAERNGDAAQGVSKFDFERVEDMDEEERWKEEAKWETISVAESRAELSEEISTLSDLIGRAERIINDEAETKISELRKMLDAMGREKITEKILIFTESRDTLEYIKGKIVQWGYSVNTIHGGMRLEERIRAESVFKNETQVMVATEAAGEGINLQFCHLMINYDLPWNPNRLEQRMGRIHRYGQQKPVKVFNLVARNTREGQIMAALFRKLEEIKRAMKSDKVFDVISEVLYKKSLEHLITDAIADKRTQDEILGEIDIPVDEGFIRDMADRLGESLATKYIDHTAIKEMRERALENKLIPEYTRGLFAKTLLIAGGKMHDRADGFVAVDLVPHEIRQIADRDGFRRRFGTALRSYPKVTFNKEEGFKNQDAEFVTFGHPLFEAVLEWVEVKFEVEPQKGAVFLDPSGRDGYVTFYEGEVMDGTGSTAGRKLFAHFVDAKTGNVTSISPTIIWDMVEPDGIVVGTHTDATGAKDAVMDRVTESLERYMGEIYEERNRQADIKRRYGVESLRLMIKRLDNDIIDLGARKSAGENVDVVIHSKNLQKQKTHARKADLEDSIKKESALTMSTPSFLGIVCVMPLVIPGKLEMSGSPEVEKIGMEIAMKHEIQEGRIPEDVSAENTGFDIRSKDTKGNYRYIEVKARANEGQVVLSQNEWYTSAQMGNVYYLYVVWNAKNNPDPKPLIIQNPAESLSVSRETVQYIVSKEEIRSKSN